MIKAPPRRTFGLQVKCARCGAACHNPDIDTTGLSLGEKEDFIVRFAEAAGWKLIVDGSGRFPVRYVICPTCQPAAEQADMDRAWAMVAAMCQRWGRDFEGVDRPQRTK